MLPAAAQGASAVECRSDDDEILALLRPLDHAPTHEAVTAERALLGALDGSCRTPVAALAEEAGGVMILRALLARPDGSRVWRCERRGRSEEHTSELQSLMRISYAVFCLKKKKKTKKSQIIYIR